jgi:hypothetical protein
MQPLLAPFQQFSQKFLFHPCGIPASLKTELCSQAYVDQHPLDSTVGASDSFGHWRLINLILIHFSLERPQSAIMLAN